MRLPRTEPGRLVAESGDDEVARSVDGHPVGIARGGLGRRSAVARVAVGAGAGDGVDVVSGHRLAVEAAGAGRHEPDALLPRVGDDEVARRVDGDPVGSGELGRGRGTAVARVAGRPFPAMV